MRAFFTLVVGVILLANFMRFIDRIHSDLIAYPVMIVGLIIIFCFTFSTDIPSKK